jgi:RecA-family ATPase
MVGEVCVLSGDTGAGKTWLGLGLVIACAQRGTWLGYDVNSVPVVVIDEENPRHVIHARLRALGLTEADAERVHYFSQEGASVGDGDSTDDWLRIFLAEHQPGLVVIDTATAATAVEDVNDNSAVVSLYRRLKQLAKEHACAFVLLHHERKHKEGTNDPGQAMLGARQWAGQADVHMAVRKTSKQPDPEYDGDVWRTTLAASVSFPKLRNGWQPDKLPITLTLESEAGTRALLTASLDAGDAAVVPSDLETQIVEALRSAGPETRTKELAAAVSREPTNSAFKAALRKAKERGAVEQVKQGRYRAVEPDEEPEM